MFILAVLLLIGTVGAQSPAETPVVEVPFEFNNTGLLRDAIPEVNIPPIDIPELPFPITPDNFTVPSGPSNPLPNVPPKLIEPAIFKILWPKLTVVVGTSPSADVKVDTQNPNGFSDVMEEVMQYFTFSENVQMARGRKIMILEEGVYPSAKQIWINSNNTEIKGQGTDKTIIKLADNSPTWLVANTSRSPGLIRGKFISYITFKDLTMDGNWVNQDNSGLVSFSKSGLYFQACENVEILNVKINNFPESGLVVGFDAFGERESKKFTVSNCEFSNNQVIGISLIKAHEFNIQSNIFNNNTDKNIYLTEGTDQVAILNNQISNGDYGIMTSVHGGYGVSNVQIENNKFINTNLAGIYTYNASGIVAKNNMIDGSRSCMKLSATNNSMFSNNICDNILLWSGKRNTTGFQSCEDCVNTILNNTLVTNGAMTKSISIPFMVICLLVTVLAF
jgi:parallel beta-helix repeat protein